MIRILQYSAHKILVTKNHIVLRRRVRSGGARVNLTFCSGKLACYPTPAYPARSPSEQQQYSLQEQQQYSLQEQQYSLQEQQQYSLQVSHRESSSEEVGAEFTVVAQDRSSPDSVPASGSLPASVNSLSE